MAPTEGRVARPERRWGCRRGTTCASTVGSSFVTLIYSILDYDITYTYNTGWQLATKYKRKNSPSFPGFPRAIN